MDSFAKVVSTSGAKTNVLKSGLALMNSFYEFLSRLGFEDYVKPAKSVTWSFDLPIQH
jgi:hypothetical protein